MKIALGIEPERLGLIHDYTLWMAQKEKKGISVSKSSLYLKDLNKVSRCTLYNAKSLRVALLDFISEDIVPYTDADFNESGFVFGDIKKPTIEEVKLKVKELIILFSTIKITNIS